MGQVYFGRGEFSKARTLWTEARPLFERSLQTKAVANIDLRLAELEKRYEANREQCFDLSVPLQLLTVEETPVHQEGEVEADVGKNTAQAVGL
jgi:hypothetical protein